jgi:hypothetical protein
MPTRKAAPPARPRAAAPSSPPALDADFVLGLTGATPLQIREVLQEAQDDRELSDHIAQVHRRGGRDFYAQIRAPFELYALTRLLRPEHIVEVGVSSGVSSSYFLRGLERNRRGTLHSIDLPTPQKGARFSEKSDSPVALPPGMGTGWVVPEPLRARWDLRLGASQDLLPKLAAELDRIDIFLHDSLHTFEHATFEFTTVDPKVPGGGVFLADNTDWLGGALDRFAESRGGKALHRSGLDMGGFAKPRVGR